MPTKQLNQGIMFKNFSFYLNGKEVDGVYLMDDLFILLDLKKVVHVDENGNVKVLGQRQYNSLYSMTSTQGAILRHNIVYKNPIA